MSSDPAAAAEHPPRQPELPWLHLEPIHVPHAFLVARHPHGEHVLRALDLYAGREPARLVADLRPSAPRDAVRAHRWLVTQIAMWQREEADGEPEAPGDDGPGDGEPEPEPDGL